MKKLLAAVAVGLAGCGHITEMTAPPADWPALTVIDHGSDGLLAACSKYTNILTWPPLGCAEVNFKTMLCHIWYVTGWVRAEELKHCTGRDHEGESVLADAWRAWKNQW